MSSADTLNVVVPGAATCDVASKSHTSTYVPVQQPARDGWYVPALAALRGDDLRPA